MSKSIRALLPMVAMTLSVSTHAQYAQMIVDDQNRVMPIFFTEPTPVNQSAPVFTGSQQRYPNDTPVVQSTSVPTNPPPAVINLPSLAKPAIQISQPKSDPIKGPYYISPARHRIMKAAHAALGIPYLYGGNNPARGLDCSSLMQFIHKNALGIKIPRTAAAQRDGSKTIPYRDLQPGDLLFFKINTKTNHVGIYIGYGQFIHASSSNRRAVISSMSLPYWKKRFVKFGSYLSS
ncbi:MAG: hypothetical protein CSB47_06785 [Proteobacteria bacterium]|nr:MAG: hypothetical protein CSB47_06785 [Pseudomonadota bacterium]